MLNSDLIQNDSLVMLNEFAETISYIHDIDELVIKISEVTSRLVKSRGSVVSLMKDGEIKIKATYGLPDSVVDVLSKKTGEELPKQVIKNNSAVFIENTSYLPSELKFLQHMFKSIICVPIKDEKDITGAICLYDKRGEIENEFSSFSKKDLIICQGLALFASFAIGNINAVIKEYERSAIDTNRKIEILFDSVKDAVLILKKDYTITSANKMLESWTSKRLEELIGKNCINIFDNKDICPHRVAEETFKTKEVHSLTYRDNNHYAEITSYPIIVKDKVDECIVIIRDITDKVAHQREIVDLYKTATETKERLESLIENSADAIVTTDLDGSVISWNKSAERIYGFSEKDTKRDLKQFLPELTSDQKIKYVESIKKGEILKDIETIVKKKNSEIIDVNITISPIKNAYSNVTGISLISRDISRRKKIEKELIKSNSKLSHLYIISNAMKSTLKLDKLLRMVLTVVTTGDGLGFNRAVYFIYDENRKILKGKMGVGPSSYEDAWQIWQDIYSKKISLADIIKMIEKGNSIEESLFNKFTSKLEVPIEDECFMSLAIKDKKAFNVTNVHRNPLANEVLIDKLGTDAYAVVPLISRDKVIGLIWVDNIYNKKQITEDDMEFLSGFANQTAKAIENAMFFEKVCLAEREMENVFESISDLVYITDKDFNIKKVNKAVCDLVKKPMKDIVGKKCYEIFHNMDSPWYRCPHWKTVETVEPYVSEIEGFYYGSNNTYGMSNSPIYDTDESFIGIVHVVRDITEIKDLREQLSRAEKAAALGELSARVAHEIRNPLVSIGGFARRLKKKINPPYDEHADVIIEEVNRLESLLSETLSFVRDTKIMKEKIEINSLLRSTVFLLQSNLKRRIIIEENLTTDTLEINGDPDRLKEAFINIINNAEQSIEGQGKIIIRTYRENNTAVIKIEDTGRGMKEEDIKYIFDPFFTTKPSGTGLGLAVTQKTIEDHNGKIDIESKEGVGTKLKIRFDLIN